MNFQPIYDFIDWLKSIDIGGGITGLHLVVAFFVLITAAGSMRNLLPKKDKKNYMIDVVCNDCGWLGQVSKFTKVCVQCKSMAVRMVKPEDLETLKKRQRTRSH